jgi:hypothetical protein
MLAHFALREMIYRAKALGIRAMPAA